MNDLSLNTKEVGRADLIGIIRSKIMTEELNEPFIYCTTIKQLLDKL